MAKPHRVALMLGLDRLYKRHVRAFAGAQRYAQEQGWESVVDEYADETLSTHSRNNLPYHGVIARATDKLARQAARLHLPVVNIWISSPAWETLPGVYPDWVNIGRMQAEHLLTRGFRRFAGLTKEGDRSGVFQTKGFVDAVTEAGCACLTAKVEQFSSDTVKKWRVSEQTMITWMNQWELPIGVFVSTESDGRIVAQMCRGRGWRIPQEVAIIAGMNEEAICESLRPTLSSVEAGFDRIGYEAARLLDRLMCGEAAPSAPILLPAQGLVVRESTDFIAVDNDLIASALAFIAAKSHLDISADDVARSVNTHPRTLQRHFRGYLDRSVATEIRNVRIERAKRDLTQTHHPLAQIARDAGFGTAIRMCEIFRREVGVTPKRYREERQEVKAGDRPASSPQRSATVKERRRKN
jgi:LacI family transcriptional regulator